MNPELYVGDPSIKEPILITTIPSDPALANLLSGTVNANSLYTITWTSYPDKPQLSLYNAFTTVRFGTNTNAYNWPYGSSIVATSNNYDVGVYHDLIQTNYLNNRLVTIVKIRNYTASPVNFWCYFKTTTFATSMGGIT